MVSLTRGKRKNRNDQRQKVVAALLAAVERLIPKGKRFTELSVETLSREAGIARSTYYMYFQDKGHLIREITAQVTNDVVKGVDLWWQVAPQATRSELHRSMLVTMQIYRRHRHLMAALAEAASYDSAVEAAFDELLDTLASRSLAALKPGQRQGTVRRDLNMDALLALVWMCERVGYRRLADGDASSLRQAVTVVTDIIWRTVYTPERS